MDLYTLLSTPKWQQRRRALQDLLARQDPGLPQALADLIRTHHIDPGALAATLQLLAELGAEGLPYILQLLQDESDEVRIYACNALGMIPDTPPEALYPLLDDPSPNVRYAAIEALGRLRDPDAAPKLAALLNSEDLQSAFSALEALRLIGSPESAAALRLALENPFLAEAAAETLASLPDRASLPAIIQAWQNGGLETASALKAIARLYTPENLTPHLPALLSLLEAQWEAVEALFARQETQTQAEIAALLGEIMSRSPHTPSGKRIAALGIKLIGQPDHRPSGRLILQHGSADLWPQLQPLLYVDNAAQATEVCQLAGDLHISQAVSDLIRILSDEAIAPDLRIQALRALTKIGDRQAVPTLLNLLGAQQARLKQAAIEALITLAPQLAESQITRLAFSENPLFREAALYLLTALPAEKRASHAAEILMLAGDIHPNVRQNALLLLPDLPDAQHAATILLEASQHPDASIRAAAARALGRLPDQPALSRLEALLEDENMWVRLYACRALGAAGRAESLPALEKSLADPLPPVRAAAAAAIAVLSPENRASLLARLANDTSPEVQATLNQIREETQ